MIMNIRNAENTAFRAGGQMSSHEYLEQYARPVCSTATAYNIAWIMEMGSQLCNVFIFSVKRRVKIEIQKRTPG